MVSIPRTDQSLPDAQDLYERLRQAVQETVQSLDGQPVHLVGIHSGGAWLARQIQTDLNLPGEMGTLNISFYRDDFDRIGLHSQTEPSEINFTVEKAHLILIDDVLYTGRTIRAAMNELFDYGRPASIRLMVLVDRGERELPIQADFSAWTPEQVPEQDYVLEQMDSGQFRLFLE